MTGAGSGIGRGLALRLASRGTRVWAIDRSAPALATLEDEAGGSIVPVCLDVAEADELVRRVRDIDEESGGLDLVVANAGIGTPTPGRSLDWADVSRVLDVNAIGAIATVSAAVPRMVERGAGHVVGVASLASGRGLPGIAAYSASKTCLAVFLEGLRIDLRGTGVAVTTISPGFVRTAMLAPSMAAFPLVLEPEVAVTRMLAAIDGRVAEAAFPRRLALARGLTRWLPPAVRDRLFR